MLDFGYKRGVPPHVATAWGCRAIIEQHGYVDVLWNRVDLVGPERQRLADYLTHRVRAAWCERATELLRNRVMLVNKDGEFVLWDDSTVLVKGNTLASHGYLYVCAYFHTRCEAFARKGTGYGACDEPLDRHGGCPRASGHVEGDDQ